MCTCSFPPQLQPGTCILPSVFSLVRPHIDFSFHGILSHINTVFVLRSKVDTTPDSVFVVDQEARKHRHTVKDRNMDSLYTTQCFYTLIH